MTEEERKKQKEIIKREKKERRENEKRKIAQMKSFKDKKDYIWEYYKFHIIGVIIAVIACYSLVDHYIINPPDKSALGIVLTTGTTINKLDEFTLDMQKKLEIPEGYKVSVTHIPFLDAVQGEYSRSLQQKLFLMLTSGEADILLCYEETILGYSPHAFFSDLTPILSQDKYSAFKDDFVYGLIPVSAINPESIDANEASVFYDNINEQIECKNRIVGIRIKNTELLKNYDFPANDTAVLAFASTGKNTENSIKMLDYILGLD